MSHNYDHHNQKLFELLPSGKRYRSLQDKTQRMTNSYFPQAVRLLGESTTPKPTPHYNNIWRNPPPLNQPTLQHLEESTNPKPTPHYNIWRSPPPPNQPTLQHPEESTTPKPNSSLTTTEYINTYFCNLQSIFALELFLQSCLPYLVLLLLMWLLRNHA